jgi:hypothetical protein
MLPNLRSVYEKLANFALNSDHALFSRLEKHKGKAIRIKTTDPYSIFYLVIRDHDLLITSEYEGDEAVRCRMKLRTLVYVVFGLEKISAYNRDIKIEGDGDLIFDITKGLEGSNLWSFFKSVFGMFVPEMKSADDFLRLILGHEPAWVARFNTLPETNREIVELLKGLQEIQQKQLLLQKDLYKEVEGIKKHNFAMITLLTFIVLQYILISTGYKLPF